MVAMFLSFILTLILCVFCVCSNFHDVISVSFMLSLPLSILFEPPPLLSHVFIGMESGYLAPLTSNLDRVASISSSSCSLISTRREFSSTASGRVAPGMGVMNGMPGRLDKARIQLMANWAGVQPFFAASSSTCLTSSRLM